jgi:hypothetical protein
MLPTGLAVISNTVYCLLEVSEVVADVLVL